VSAPELAFGALVVWGVLFGVWSSGFTVGLLRVIFAAWVKRLDARLDEIGRRKWGD